jgi:putative ATP-binding cassette transporter
MKKTSLGTVLKRIWKMAIPYWTQSNEKFGSLLLVLINFAQMALVILVTVRMNAWTRDWNNALANTDFDMWAKNLYVLLIVGGSMMIIGSLQQYTNAWFQLRWRRWMTARYIRFWLEGGTHYRMQLTGNETDNPDQRIQDDVTQFTGGTWNYLFSLINNFASFGTYVTILWNLSNTIPLYINGVDYSFPGYFIVVAFVWALIGTVVAHVFGNPLVRLQFNQQMYDANFRYALVRVRENSEQIALLKGENVEHGRLMVAFGDIVMNSFRTMGTTLRMGFATGVLGMFDGIYISLLLGPALMAGILPGGMGAIQQIATYIQSVGSAFKWIQTNYAMLAPYVAVVNRLYAFNDNYELTQKAVEASDIKISQLPDDGITVKNLSVFLPDKLLPDGTILPGKLQIIAENLTFGKGEKILIKGRTGAGKTTLFRVLSGIWPFGTGDIKQPKNRRVIVLPQSPYFPIGTLEQAMSYPETPGTYRREDLEQSLRDVGMDKFVPRIDEIANWNMMLSGGEQQRIGIARAMLYNPDYLFFDEATASMDEPSEEELYTMLLKKMKDTTIISIGHRSSLERFHSRLIVAEIQPEGNYKFVEKDHMSHVDF